MRYGTWNVTYTDDLSEGGTTPPEFNGAFFSNLANEQVAGYMPDETIIADYSYWNTTEITEEEFFALAKTVNPQATMENGYVSFPSLDSLA